MFDCLCRFNINSSFALIVLIALLCLTCGDNISCGQVLLGVAFAATLAGCDRCASATNNTAATATA